MMGWTPSILCEIVFASDLRGDGNQQLRKESKMDATTFGSRDKACIRRVGIDLAKSVFQLAVADGNGRVIEQHRLARSQFERWFNNKHIDEVIMEACGSAHHWARWLTSKNISVKLLPAAYVRAYVKRNKTDAADAKALLEAARSEEIIPVKIKSVEQQALQ